MLEYCLKIDEVSPLRCMCFIDGAQQGDNIIFPAMREREATGILRNENFTNTFSSFIKIVNSFAATSHL